MRESAASAPVRDSRTEQVLSALLEQGLVAPDRGDEARAVVDRVLTGQGTAAGPLDRRLAELAGYVGGALLVGAVALFLATQWGTLGPGTQVALLLGVVVLLGGCGGLVARAAGGPRRLRLGREAVRRRLAGVLLTGAAAAGAAAVGIQVESAVQSADAVPALLGFLTLAVLSTVGYLVAPTVVGQLGIAFGTVMTLPWALEAVGDIEPVALGLLVLVVGAGWLVAAELRVWREGGSARVIGCLVALVGAQIPVFDNDLAWVGYVLLVALAVAAFATYVVRAAWPYLAVGVAAVTLVVPEALLDYAEGSLGAAGALLAAGATLLVASLVGLRLRREVTDA